MEKETVFPVTLPSWMKNLFEVMKLPFPPAVKAGGFVFVSGVTCFLDRKTEAPIDGGAGRWVFGEKCTIYLIHLGEVLGISEEYGHFDDLVQGRASCFQGVFDNLQCLSRQGLYALDRCFGLAI